MALDKLRYSVDDLDKAKEIIANNMHRLKVKDPLFEEKYKYVSDHHWGEKITLANKIVDLINADNGNDN